MSATAVAIRQLDEHWNGKGHPDGLKQLCDQFPAVQHPRAKAIVQADAALNKPSKRRRRKR